MKNKILVGIAILTISAVAAFNLNLNSNKDTISSLSLANVEALAQENTTEKKYRYDTIWNDECWIYVGGAYAKGKKVNCWDGNEHPICVDCTL